MTFNSLRAMSEREKIMFFTKITATKIKEIFKNEKIGGISKLKKESLVELLLDLLDGVESNLTKLIKSCKSRKTRQSKKEDKEKNPVDKNISLSESIRLQNLKEREKEKELECEQYNAKKEYSSTINADENIMYENMLGFAFEKYNEDTDTFETSHHLYFMCDNDCCSNPDWSDIYIKCKSKYRKLAKAFHQDGSTPDNNKFIIVQKAWEEAENMYKTMFYEESRKK